MAIKQTVKSAFKPDATTGKVIAGIALFGAAMYLVRRIPDTVPGAGVVKQAANIATGG